MGWFILKHIFSTIFSFITIGRLSEQEKDLEILVLRQQLSILQRKLDHPIRPSRVEKMTLAVLTSKTKQISHRATDQLQDVIRIFQPETILRWHRELVRRKWTYPNKNKGGRPATSDQRPARKSKTLFSVSPEKTRAGVTAKSRAKSSS